MPERNSKPLVGTIYINGEKFEGPFTSFTYDSIEVEDKIRDYINQNMRMTDSFTFTCTISKIQLLKLMGLWDWVFENCPSGRVMYHMQHGSERTKLKNYKHAQRLICRKVKKV